MIALPQHRMTVPEFLRWAETQDRGRYELLRGEIVAMAPERIRHNLVKLNIAVALREAVRAAGLSCTVFTDGVTVVIGDDTAYEPDAAVQCEGKADLDGTVAEAPLIVVEVTSPSSEKTDAAGKLADYFTVETVQHYLIADPIRRLVVAHRRASSTIETRIVREGYLRLDPPGLDLAIGAFFELP